MSKETGGEQPRQKREITRQIPRSQEGGDLTPLPIREVFSKDTEGAAPRTPKAIITDAIEFHGQPDFTGKAIRIAEIPVTVGLYQGEIAVTKMMNFQEGDKGPHEVYQVVQPITDDIANMWIVDPTTERTQYRRINKNLEIDSGWNPATEKDQRSLDKILKGIDESQTLS